MKSYVLFLCSILIPVIGLGLEVKSEQIGSQRYSVATVNPKKERMALFWKSSDGQILGGFDKLKVELAKDRLQLLFAMNAGMFHADRKPVGLCISNLGKVAELNLDSGEGNFFLKPNGVFLLNEHGASVMDAADFKSPGEKPVLATQSGPLLVKDGKIHPAFRENSPNLKIRNGVGVRADGQVVMVISDTQVSFFNFATAFRDRWQCPNALFLDGIISSIHAPTLQRNDSNHDLGPILAVVASAAP